MTTTTPKLFIPHALARAPIVCEARIIRDDTMPDRDWSVYDEIAVSRWPEIRLLSQRIPVLRQAVTRSSTSGSNVLPFFLRPQAG